MVNLTLKQNVRWHAPLPVWAENSSTGLRVINEALAPCPSILRFASDSFMQEILDVMQNSPRRISEWLVQSETWRQPMKSPEPVVKVEEENSLKFLLDRTHKLTEQRRPSTDRPLRLQKSRAMIIGEDLKIGDVPIKLFQSTHQRYYLVSASLLVNQAGLPDQPLNLAQQEKASFVLRRLVPPEGQSPPADGEAIDNLSEWDEYAYINTPGGARWKRIDFFSSQVNRQLQDNEDQLPLFPVGFQDDCAHNRVLFSGLIPVGRREKWMGAPVANQVAEDSGNTSAEAPVSRAQLLFQSDVTEPWKTLVEQAEYKKQGLARSFEGIEGSGNSSEENDRARRTQRDIIQMASWYVLLDCAKFLKSELPAVWNVMQQLASNPGLLASDFDLTPKEVDLLERFDQASLDNTVLDALLQKQDQYAPSSSSSATTRRNTAINNATVRVRMIEALVDIVEWEQDLEKVETAFMRFDEDASDSNGNTPKALEVDPLWPDFLFPLADPQFNGPVPGAGNSSTPMESRLEIIDELAKLVGEILPEPADPDSIVDPSAALSQRDAWFVIRCVYERPHCGPLYPALLSDPTRVFTMAPFFDPDAPSRPVRIPMPLDISPAGLRKYQKNTAFVISDMLCGKIKKIRKITFGDLVLSVLPWPFHKDLPNPGDTGPCKGSGGLDFGMICSLSIPIVTLCALILLMIMVALFDLFFRWIPFLFLCLPIPGLKGKG